MARGQPPPTRGEISTSLQDLVARGLVRTWQGSKKGPRPGRRRAFYELTASGVAVAETVSDEGAAQGAGAGTGDAGESARAIDARLRRSLEISAVADALRRPRKGTSTRR
jgi:DNA-binding PadR family transcriptional regulator